MTNEEWLNFVRVLKNRNKYSEFRLKVHLYSKTYKPNMENFVSGNTISSLLWFFNLK